MHYVIVYLSLLLDLLLERLLSLLILRGERSLLEMGESVRELILLGDRLRLFTGERLLERLLALFLTGERLLEREDLLGDRGMIRVLCVRVSETLLAVHYLAILFITLLPTTHAQK